MDERRSYLKDLATQQADAWAASTPPSAFGGEMRVETRNTVYTFKDALCVSVTRRDRAFRSDPTTIVGMRMLGWLVPDDLHAGLQASWRPGAYAVLWRARGPADATSSVALTSPTTTMLAIRRTNTMPPGRSVPPPLPARASSKPPPVPARMVPTSSPPPASRPMPAVKITTPPMPTFGAIGRPPTPSHVRPRPQSMTRMNQVPQAPPTPTPATLPRPPMPPAVTPTSAVTRRPTAPPPLPARARSSITA